MNSLFSNLCISAFASLGFIGSAVFAQQMIPKMGSGCPSGTSNAGSGYCKPYQSTKGQYVPKMGSGCPSGTSNAGSGYCKTYN